VEAWTRHHEKVLGSDDLTEERQRCAQQTGVLVGRRTLCVTYWDIHNSAIAQIAKDLGISVTGLGRWMDQADIDDGHKAGLSSDERAELVQLRGDKRVIEMEIEILKLLVGLLHPALQQGGESSGLGVDQL
jgi:transposase-like protein